MPEQRIILANGSRLLHEMLNRILVKTKNSGDRPRNYRSQKITNCTRNLRCRVGHHVSAC